MASRVRFERDEWVWLAWWVEVGGDAAAMLLLACVAVLSLLTLGFVGVIVAIVICLALVIGLQYVLWGWWLTAYLQRQEAAASSSKSLSRSSGNTPAPDPPST